MAVALTRHRFPPGERERRLALMRRAIQRIAARLGIDADLAVGSYHDPADALQAEGHLTGNVVEAAEVMHKLFALDAQQVWSAWGGDPVRDYLQRRDDAMETLNSAYQSLITDLMRYSYFQLYWMFLGMSSAERPYVDDLARRYLGRSDDLLPTVADEKFVGEKAILACYAAARATARLSPAASRYFYKRYRALLLAMLQVIDLNTPTHTQRVR